MSEEDQTVDVKALPKFDIPSYESKMTAKDVKSLALRHVFRVLGDKGAFFCLPIGRYQAFSCTYFSACTVSKQGHWFSFEKRVGKGAGGQVFRETFSGLKGWKQSMQDVEALTERVIDLRPVPFGLLFQGGLATTWDYPGFRPIFKDTEGNGPALTSQDRIPQHTTCPIPEGQDIPEKTDHQRRVEVEDPKIVATRERKARVAAKKREKKKQGGDCEEGSWPKTKRRKTTGPESRENRSPPASPRDSANRSVHNYSDHRDEETDDLNLGSSGEQSGRALTLANTEVLTLRRASHPERGALYVPGWSIHRRCRVDNPMWCRELMVHLTDILERFDNLQTDFEKVAESHAECGDLSGKLVQARLDLTHSTRLYTSLSDCHKALKNEHEGCVGKLEGLENRNRELTQANMDQVLRIKELEAALAQKDSALVYAERINAEQAQEKETLGKGLAEERSEEDLLELMGRMEGFDVHVDTRMRVEYDKLFERRYPYVENISRGFCHFVSDLLKVYPDSPPREQVPPHKPSSEKAPATSAPPGS
nr:hypothetical protein [Tanacetum cinerariifolium]